jgi:hypothetical protein
VSELEVVSQTRRGDPDAGPATWLQVPAINIGAQVDIVGESFYQDAIEDLAVGRTAFGTRRRLLNAVLIREPDNRHDPNAVRIEAIGVTIGHLSQQDAPRFHDIIGRLARAGAAATCRAILTGGWDRGSGDRGFIGVKVLTGRSPSKWNGRVPFMPSVPWHEYIGVDLRDGHSIDNLPPKAVATVDHANLRLIDVSINGITIGHIPGRSDLAGFIASLRARGLPSTAPARVSDGQLLVTLVDPGAVTDALDQFDGMDLPVIRRRVAPTGRWICHRCHRIWNDQRQPPRNWYEVEDENSGSPHICPGCGSYRFTHPLSNALE